MNEVSKLLYFIDVLYAVQGVMIGVAIFSIVGLLFLVLVRFINESNGDTLNEEPYQKYRQRLYRKRLAIILIVATVGASLIPSRSTMYAMLANKLSSQFYETNTGKEISNDAVKALRSWLESQTRK
jgi:hypothetical protein